MIYRSVTGCHGRRCRCGEQGLPKCITDIRQPFLASASVAVGLRSVRYRRTSAAARVSIVDASNAPNFVEITPSLRNAETIKSASRDAKTVTMVHQTHRSFLRPCSDSSSSSARFELPRTEIRELTLGTFISDSAAFSTSAGNLASPALRLKSGWRHACNHRALAPTGMSPAPFRT